MLLNLSMKEIRPLQGLKGNCHVCDQHFRTLQAQNMLSFRYLGTLGDTEAA